MPSCLDIGRGGGIAYKLADGSLLPQWQWLLGDGGIMHTITAGPRCPWCPGLSVSFSELSPLLAGADHLKRWFQLARGKPRGGDTHTLIPRRGLSYILLPLT